jgi:hypothetical protein
MTEPVLEAALDWLFATSGVLVPERDWGWGGGGVRVGVVAETLARMAGTCCGSRGRSPESNQSLRGLTLRLALSSRGWRHWDARPRQLQIRILILVTLSADVNPRFRSFT